MKVLLTGAFNYSNEQIKKIQQLGLDIIFEQDEKNIEADVSDIDIVVGNSVFLYNDIKKFKNLKYIQLTSAGLDRVPLDYIKEKGIVLKNARGVYSIPMAEWTILKILEIYKNTSFFLENQKRKKWEKCRNIFELSEKKVSIIGFGSVGQEIAKRLKAFETYIIAADKEKIKETEYVDEIIGINSLDDTLKKSDIVIITLPLTEETKGLFNKEKLQIMKKDSVLINISRGKIIKEKDLIEIIKTKKFLGIALDVFEEEPLNEKSELWNLENVIISPHNSFIGENNNYRMFKLICENLENFIIKKQK